MVAATDRLLELPLVGLLADPRGVDVESDLRFSDKASAKEPSMSGYFKHNTSQW